MEEIHDLIVKLYGEETWAWLRHFYYEEIPVKIIRLTKTEKSY